LATKGGTPEVKTFNLPYRERGMATWAVLMGATRLDCMAATEGGRTRVAKKYTFLGCFLGKVCKLPQQRRTIVMADFKCSKRHSWLKELWLQEKEEQILNLH